MVINQFKVKPFAMINKANLIKDIIKMLDRYNKVTSIMLTVFSIPQVMMITACTVNSVRPCPSPDLHLLVGGSGCFRIEARRLVPALELVALALPLPFILLTIFYCPS